MSHRCTLLDRAILGRLRSAGYNVVDCSRPGTADDMSVNHGGVVVIDASDITLSPIIVALVRLNRSVFERCLADCRRTLSPRFNGGAVSVL